MKKPARGGLERGEMDELLFELRGPEGQQWRLYLDGRIEGFPPGTAVLNHAMPLWSRLIGKLDAKGVAAGGGWDGRLPDRGYTHKISTTAEAQTDWRKAQGL